MEPQHGRQAASSLAEVGRATGTETAVAARGLQAGEEEVRSAARLTDGLCLEEVVAVVELPLLSSVSLSVDALQSFNTTSSL